MREFRGVILQKNLVFRGFFGTHLFPATCRKKLVKAMDEKLSALKNSEQMLEGIGESLKRFGDSKELLQKVLDTIPQTVFWKDINLNYLGCNQLFAVLAGKSCPAELLGLDDFDLPWDRDEAEFYRACDRRVMESGQAEIGIIESQVNADGELTWLETNKVPLHNDGGEVIGILGTYHDITKLKRAEEILQRNNEELERRVDERTRELAFVAHHDGLTGLANRLHFVQLLNKVLNANEQEQIALMFIDLDNFKPINDKDGHEAGDELLKQFANGLRSLLGPLDFAGRFGGDEFLCLFRNVKSQEYLEKICEEIRRQLNSEIKINGKTTIATASIGMVLCDSSEYENSDDLVNDADLAMYAAKGKGKSRYQFFDPSMRDSAQNELNEEKHIATGIIKNQFVLHYQPILNLAKRELVGFEALVRWQHPTRGLLYPDRFISTAESSGVIVPLGEQIIEIACRQLANWCRNQSNLPREFRMNINLSPRQLFEPDFVQSLRYTLSRFDIEPDSICLEITESLLLKDSGQAIQLLREIREEGIHLSLDDFGTGYSSLNYLDDLPVDSLKIDRSFVSKLDPEVGDHAIIRMIIALAETLNIGVVAEGVENEQQLKLLESMNCQFVQGYFFSRPMPVQESTQYLAQSQTAHETGI